MIRYPHFTLFDDVKDTPVPAGGGAAPKVEAPKVEAPKGPSSSEVNWADESAREPSEVVVRPEDVTPAATPTPAPVDATAPAPSTTAVTPAAAEPTPTPTPAPSPVTEPAPAAAVAPAPEPSPAAAPAPAVDVQKLRNDEHVRLTKAYALTEDMARQVMVEPEKVLPEMFARVQMNTAEMVASHIYASLPALIQQHLQVGTVAQQNERQFFDTWPELAKKPEYRATVENAIRTYRQLNPKATKEEVVRASGLAAMITLRLPLPQNLFVEPPAPVAPAPSFAHAAPAASAPAPVPMKHGNAFTQLNEEFDREEG